MTTKPKILEYERETCGRCGGSGHYSYNQIDGTRCYGCGGTGKRLTKRGSAAVAFANAMLEVPIQDVPQDQQAIYSDALTGKRYRFTGTIMEPGQPIKSIKNGVEREFPNDTYTLLFNGKPAEPPIGLGTGIRVRKVPTTEQLKEIAAYQDSLTKAGKPRKR